MIVSSSRRGKLDDGPEIGPDTIQCLGEGDQLLYKVLDLLVVQGRTPCVFELLVIAWLYATKIV
jgi:hypothetical protein